MAVIFPEKGMWDVGCGNKKIPNSNTFKGLKNAITEELKNRKTEEQKS